MSKLLRDQMKFREISPGEYTISWHNDWLAGRNISGLVIAAAVQHAASTYVRNCLPAYPDIIKLHIEFLSACIAAESHIKVQQLKTGAILGTLYVEIRQGGKARVMALATVTDLDKAAGLTLPPSDWYLQPKPNPVPNFDAIEAQKPEPNWLRYRMDDTVLPISTHLLCLYPSIGFPYQGLTEGWMRFASNDDHVDAMVLAAMCDMVPSPCDTAARNGGVYDAHTYQEVVSRWAASQDPPGSGPPAVLIIRPETAHKTAITHYTVSMDIEFKRRLPKEGLRWVYTRSGTRMVRDGWVDLDVTLCDHNMELVCVGHQLQVVVDFKKRYGPAKPGPRL